MITQECLHELRTMWLPNMTDAALDRLIDLLEKGSPMLIHGSFSRAFPMGCLATHIAWQHPSTSHLVLDAGVCWLSNVAGLNPVTSHVIREWDQAIGNNWDIRAAFMTEFKNARQTRRAQAKPPRPRFRVAKKVAAR